MREREPQTIPDCSKCGDLGYIQVDYNTYRPCKCLEVKRMLKMLKDSGIGEAYQKIGFKNYETWNEQTKKAKEMAMRYVKDFEKIRDTRHNSISMLGQVGSGKTHLGIAITNNLMTKEIPVVYMQYRDVLSHIKMNMDDEGLYQRELNRFKNAEVLFIDDLYKGRITGADHNIMFEIVNYRYFNMKPMIISSELIMDRLCEGEFEAVGTRIMEMSRGHVFEFQGVEANYRLR